MGMPAEFSYVQRKNGDIVISHHGVKATTLRGDAAEKFLKRLSYKDPQWLMARTAGNYKRGNERAKNRKS